MVRRDKRTLWQSLRAWNDFMPFAWLVPAFGMPIVGLQLQALMMEDARISAMRFFFAGLATLAAAGLALILLHVDQHYYGDDVCRARLSLSRVRVPPREAFLAAVFLVLAGGWAAYSSGKHFLAMWGLLVALMAADAFFLHRFCLVGSLTAAAVVVMQCLLPVAPLGEQPVAIVAACGFGLLVFFVTRVVLYKPKFKGPVRAQRLSHAWHPLIVQLMLSTAVLVFLAVVVPEPSVFCLAAACGVLVLGAWSAYRISKPLTREGIMPHEREAIDAYCGLPMVCLQASVLIGNRHTVLLGGLLLGAILIVECLPRLTRSEKKHMPKSMSL